jgi:hypothetical protein
MSTPRKIVVASTDGRFIGDEITVVDGEATVSGFTFHVTAQTGDRIVGPNYSVTYQIKE